MKLSRAGRLADPTRDHMRELNTGRFACGTKEDN